MTKSSVLNNKNFRLPRSCRPMAMAPFVYLPLETDGHVIRLVTLLPGDFDDDLQVELAQARLSPPPPTHPVVAEEDRSKSRQEDQKQYADGHYTALSYVWGSTEDPKHISVREEGGSSGTLVVTRNLEEALRYLRHAQEPRVMWIDAICINQADMDERSRQVVFMARLYNTARDVVVWLGPDKDDGEFALTFLKSWGDRISVNWTKTAMEILGKREDTGDCEFDAEFPKSMSRGRLNDRESWALYHLMNREWFERLWVRQEAITMTPTSIRCGNTEFGSPALMRTIFMMQTRNIWFDLPVDETLRFLERRKLVYDLIVARADTRPLDRLRFDLSGLKWGQPVDAIYASQNLLTSLEKDMNIVPDYTLSATTVFQDLATQLINHAEKLTLFHTCELASKSLPDLPSWVPDWSNQIKVSAMDVFWSASAWISASYSLEPENVLRAAGIHKATVRTAFDLATKPQNQELLFLRISHHMWTLLPDDLSAPYIGGGDLCEAYTKTFSAEHCRERYSEALDRVALQDAKEFIRELRSISAIEGVADHLRACSRPGMGSYLNAALALFRGRSFITTDEGYIGLAPQDAQPGDRISVILGCRMPMLLRPMRSTPGSGEDVDEPSQKWQIVGACYVSGLMNGEAIYGQLPEWISPISTTIQMNMQRMGFRDARTGEINSDCVTILEDYGVKVDKVLYDPWKMYVSRNSLKAKGVALEMIDIV
ncbi:heterokaryon incompatibility protein-domain-containing protein [Microdochium bolleyi]|uniref:Heterokaryon incompatibility protein-domain-containing protein n=1 Tax=Microdochium bolleyi TaxID=196109 RepID=A0A136IWE1_9PEZI|nr:heterokaryon incompatibility protein-domain-containing protein [Microdochium bolleyi]